MTAPGRAAGGRCGEPEASLAERQMEQRYEFRVTGRLSQRAQDAFAEVFDAMGVVEVPPETIIYGPVIDESHLHGVLALIQSLGLHVVSVRQTPGVPAKDG